MSKPAASPAACLEVERLTEAKATGVVTSQEQAQTGNQKTESCRAQKAKATCSYPLEGSRPVKGGGGVIFRGVEAAGGRFGAF